MYRKANYIPVRAGGQRAQFPASRWGRSPLHALWRLSPGRLAMYLDQLGDLLNAGVTLYEAMNQLAFHAHDGRLRRLSREIAGGASRGEAFAAQLAAYPQLIPPQVRGMLLVGERAGALPAVCSELANELREQQSVHWKVTIGELWFGAIFFLALFVPGLVRMINPEHVNVAAYVNYLRTIVLPIIVGVIVLWNGTKFVAAIPAVIYPLQTLLYYIPGIRQLQMRAAMVRFGVALEALVRAGVEIQEALAIAAETTGNIVATRQLQRAARRVREGTSLYQALQGCKCLPKEMTEALALAEQAGTYERTLQGLTSNQRLAKTRTLWFLGIAGYAGALLLSAVVVIVVVYITMSGYLNALLTMADEVTK